MADSASRYQPIDAPAMAPGVDWLTRSAVGPFVDTGVNVQFSEMGRIYLSESTIRELADAAGILESGKQEGVLIREAEIFNQGYAQAVKENISGQLFNLVDRLTRVLDTLSSWSPAAELPAAPEVAVADAENTGPVDQGEPPVLVTDGETPARTVAPERELAGRAAKAGGQGNGPRVHKRPARVPAGAGDGNPFRI